MDKLLELRFFGGKVFFLFSILTKKKDDLIY